MSETVRFFLESRVPELEDLFKKGLFSQEEIKEIVAKRTKFEHKIKRRGCLLDDFLAYIRYETDLEALRKERAALLKIKGKHTISDHSIVKYILSLYRKAVKKFRGFMPLWDQYIAFAQEAQVNKTMTKIFASALQMHPEAVEIWIKAALWELDQLQNPSSARALFMRGLRFNKTALSLWLAYFKMELEVADRLASKRMELDETFTSTNEQAESESLSVFSGAIAISVFKYAVKECSLSAADVFLFYQLAAKYSERLGAVQAFVYDFVSQPGSVVDAYAFFVAKAADAIKEFSPAAPSAVACIENCMRELNAAMSSSLTSAVIAAVMQVLKGLLEAVKGEPEMFKMIGAKMNRIFQGAQENSCMTAELYLQWIELNASDAAAQKVILSAALKAFPESIQLQQLQLSASKSTDLSQVKSTILSKLTPKTTEYDVVLADIFGSEVAACNDLLDLAQAGVKNGRPVMECIKYVLKHGSLDSLLSLIDTSRLQTSFLQVLLKCLMEANLITKPAVIKFLNKVTIFSTASYQANVDLCLSLAKAALMAGDLELLSRVSTQASQSEEFTRKFEELKASIY